MKLCRHLIVLGAAAGLVMPGCTPEEETLIDTGEILTLTASAKEITLKESDGEKEALKLTWTPASNYGLEEEVYYTLEIASADTEYADGFSRDMGKSTFSITWTGEELNTFLTEQFEAESGTMEKYKARITATIYGRDDLTQTAETEFSAKTYTPTSYTLYINGSALADPTAGKMTLEDAAGQFSWTGDMIRGTFRFAAQNEYWPGYKRNSQSEDYWTITSLNYNEFDDVLPDVGFTVLKNGKYTVTVDFLTYKVSLELVEEHETTYEENLYILFASEWDNDPVRTEMKKESEGIFSWEGFVTVGGHDKIADGEFQIFTSPEPRNWWPRYTLTYTNDPDYKDRIDLYSYDPTMSIDIAASGKYRIVINLVEMTYEITPIDSPEQGSGVGFDTAFEGENDIVLPDRHI